MKLSLCAEDLRSAYNVGSLFRTGDAVGIGCLYLTGRSAYPPHPRVLKTALGSQTSVRWEYHESSLDLLVHLKSQGYQLAALEVTPQATSLFSFTVTQDICLIVGNEVNGVSSQVLELVDSVMSIPMSGIKSSLNVSVAAAVALYECKRQMGLGFDTVNQD